MSEVVNKPVDEPVAAPEAPAAATESTPEAKAVEEPSAETPVVAEAATETPAVAEEAAKEPEPFAEEGILDLKGPGFIKTIFSSKKFFWFGSDPIDEKSLASYTRGEKDSSHNVAWASHTGKGLLLFSKKASEKATPAGVINLSDISEVVAEGDKSFHFNVGKDKFTLEASSTADRDHWVSALNTKAAEAKELAPTVTGHEAYKSKLEHLKPAVIAAPVVAAKEEKKEEKAEAKEEKKEEKKETKKRTSRSASRKRTSIFGTFGKKEEAKKEESAEAAAVAPETDAAPVEATPAVAEPVVPAAEETAAAAPVEETPVADAKPAEVKPVASKRNSFFGTLSSKFPKKETKSTEAEAAPAVPAKDAEPVSETAPVIPAVETTEPLATSTLTPAAVPAETVTNGETKAVETPNAGKDKRKSSLPWLSSKKEKSAATSEDETEKPKSPFSQIRNTFKKVKSPKTPTSETAAATETPAATETAAVPEAPVAEEAKAEEPVVSEPVSAAPVASTPVAASA